MQPDVFQIDKVETLHQFFRARRPHGGVGWFFRGQGDRSWPLVPKAGRKEFFLEDLVRSENSLRFGDLARFGYWMKQVFPFARDLPENDYEALAYAQHHGLATRLLDWSLNPLVATFFAVRELPEEDAAVFCYNPRAFIDVKSSKLPIGGSDQARLYSRILDDGEQDASGVDASELEDQMDALHGSAVVTRAFDARMLNQRGVFTVHWPPNAALHVTEVPYLPGTSNLSILVIPAKVKAELREHLADYGFSDEFIYPDADGVSSRINWETQGIARKRNLKVSRQDNVVP